MLITSQKSCLLLVDVQEKLMPFIYEHEKIKENCSWLLRAAKKLSIPTLVSEQYPKGIGHTIPELKQLVIGDPTAEKLHFSCAEDQSCLTLINNTKREQIVVIGIEAHVCVMQTAIGLQEQNKQVFVVADCIGSRNPNDKQLAIDRMRHNGIEIVSKEMVLFEWLHQSGTDLFREVSKEFLR